MQETVNTSDVMRVISYAHVSTGSQAASGLGTAAQHRAVHAAADVRGWQIIATFTDDAVSAAVEPHKRPQLSEALAQLDAGEADAIAAVRLDRFIRNTRDALTLLESAKAGGWDLVCLDMPGESETPGGKFMHMVICAYGEMERALISERTIAALAVARSRGQRLGRPSRQPQAAKDLAVAMHVDGQSLRKIAVALEDARLPTATGKTTWPPSSVKALLRTARLDHEAKANAARHAANLL